MRYQLILIVAIMSLPACSELRTRQINYDNPTALRTGLTYEYQKKDDPNYFKTKYKNAPDKKAVRNSILYELLGIIDDDYNKFELSLRADRAYKDILVSVVSLGLTGFASLSGQTAANNRTMKTRVLHCLWCFFHWLRLYSN